MTHFLSVRSSCRMLWVVLVFCTLFSQVCNAATGAPPAAHGEEPPVVTIINSDHMLAENIENKIHFSGHVHLVKGHLKLTADTLDVFFVPPGKGGTLMENMQGKSGSQKIQTMVARGHVVILKDLRQAFAGKAVYIEASHLFVLTELPVVIENGDRISGERITFFTRINKSLVQGHGLMLLNGKGSRKKDSSTSPGKGAP
ncbi:MAG: LptA/OstA family protein [Leptospirillum sp.]